MGIVIPRNRKGITIEVLISALLNEDKTNLAKELGYSNSGDGGFKSFRDKLFTNKPPVLKSYSGWLLISVGYKTCGSCSELKRLGLFHNSIASVSGVSAICKDCDSARKYIYCKSNREKCNKASRDHYRLNKEKYIARNAKRRAIEIQAIPLWADLEKIEMFYINRPEGYHVDHIIPLNNALVCGLHVLDNLQYLTKTDNLKKSNKFNIC